MLIAARLARKHIDVPISAGDVHPMPFGIYKHIVGVAAGLQLLRALTVLLPKDGKPGWVAKDS